MAVKDFENYLTQLQTSAKGQQDLDIFKQAGVVTKGIGDYNTAQEEKTRKEYDMWIDNGYEPLMNGKPLEDAEVFSKMTKGKHVEGITWSKVKKEETDDMVLPTPTEIEMAAKNGINLAAGIPQRKSMLRSWTGIPKPVKDEKPEEVRVLFDAYNGAYYDPSTKKPIDILDEKYAGKRIIKDVFTPSKPMTSEAGGKVAMANLGLQSLKEAEETLMPGGVLDKNILAGASLGKPFGGVGEKGRIVFSKINDAVEAKLRAETGAAATTDEINRIAQRYYPNYLLDNEATIKDKFKRLKTFLTLARVTVDPAGRFNIDEPTATNSTGWTDEKEIEYQKLLKEVGGK